MVNRGTLHTCYIASRLVELGPNSEIIGNFWIFKKFLGRQREHLGIRSEFYHFRYKLFIWLLKCLAFKTLQEINSVNSSYFFMGSNLQFFMALIFFHFRFKIRYLVRLWNSTKKNRLLQGPLTEELVSVLLLMVMLVTVESSPIIL